MQDDPGLYDYSPIVNRPRLTWPDGARLAFWVAPNIEFYELDPPASPVRSAWFRPIPDIPNYAHRDYGNRAGVWRMIELMDRCGIRGSVSLNVALCDHMPDIIEACVARGWELFSHSVYNTRYAYGMDREQERAVIRDVQATIRKYSGQDCHGWLSSALANTVDTMDLLAEEGIRYTLDLMHDDQPQPVKVKKGRLISVPYSLEVNDWTALHVYAMPPRVYTETIKAQFDRLYAEGAESGRVMCVPLHPFLVGMPHRAAALEEALAYITGHSKVWVTTGREIADWYLRHHYDAAVEALRTPRGTGR
jgi:allantoinase